MQAFLIIIFLNLFLYVSSLSYFSESNDDGLALFGDAFFISDKNHSVSLTQELPSCRFPSSSDSTSTSPTTEFFPFPDNGNGVGRAVYGRPIQFLDPTTNTTTSFSSTFSFSVVPSPLCSAGDGLAFLISPDAIPDSGAGAKGRIGLPGPPFATFFAVEFDTSFDPLLGDSGANHVGLDLDGPVSAASADLGPVGIDLRAGKEITAWVEYRGPDSLLRVWVAYSPDPRPDNPVLVAELDLSDRFEDSMYVGFSGSNGHGSSLHVINTWKFKTFDHHSALLLPMDDFVEGDCFICSFDSPLTSNATTSTTTSTDPGKNDPLAIIPPPTNVRVLRDTILGIGGFLALAVSILAIGGVSGFLAIKRKRKRGRRTTAEIRASSPLVAGTRAVPARLSLAEIWAATMGFDQRRIVGVGASATVYKGSLPLGGGEVAIKRFRGRAGEASSRAAPFENELARMADCLRHKNLIELRGWCCEGAEVALVYEYMPRGSLEDALHGPRSEELGWRERVGIAAGVACALAFLHEDCQRQVVHRDVKACNIMLDCDLTPKLADFGLAVAGPASSGGAAAGTVGYVAPEYACSGVATAKTDVYSLGVVVLEVGTGRRAVGEDGVSVVDWAWGLWETGSLSGGLDPRLAAGHREVERMLLVGLACVHPNPVKRPTAREALRILNGEVPLPALPPRKPRLRLRTLALDETRQDPFLTLRSDFL